MQTDLGEEWRRLAALYGDMSDVEIRELVDQINDLTETAQQVLRGEIKKRGIKDSEELTPQRPAAAERAQIHVEPRYYRSQFAEASAEEDIPHEYTWKVPLCERDTREQTWALAEALKRRGIDSWVKAPGAGFGSANYEILVAADQLDDARSVEAQPIPAEILRDIEAETSSSAYELPSCPKCGAADPILESVEPSNNWLCECCGNAWSDPIEDRISGQP